MRLFRRFIALLLACALLPIPLISTAFAKQNSINEDAVICGQAVSDNAYDIVVLNSNNEKKMSLAIKEREGGITEFILIEDGTITSKAVLDRKEKMVSCSFICNDEVCFSTTSLPEYTFPEPALAATNNVANANSYSPVGAITYQYYDQGYVSGTRKIDLAFSEILHNDSRYNINGTYQSMASFAAFLAGLFAVPGVIAGLLAAKVVEILAIGLGAGSLLIPSYYVRAIEYENKWKLTISTSVTEYMTGSKFIFNHEYDGSTQTACEGDYYTISDYSNRNTSLATAVMNNMPLYWGGDGRVEVVSWE